MDRGAGPAVRLLPHFQIFPDGQYFHLRHRGVAQQSLTPHWGHRLRLKKDPKVSLVWEAASLGLSHLAANPLPSIVLVVAVVAVWPSASHQLCNWLCTWSLQ